MPKHSTHNFQAPDDGQVQEEKKPICKVFGYDTILTDQDEIDYYHIWVKQLIIRNKLVGSISDSGNYNVKDRVKRDLVKMEKEIADESPTYYIALSVYMKKTFNFAIEIDFLEDNMASASLYLNELLDEHSTVPSLRTFIAKIILPYDAMFKDRIFEVFHLVDSVNRIQDTDVPFLAIYMQEQYDESLFIDEIEDIGSQIYLMRILKMLESGGEVGQTILKEYKDEVTKLGLDENKKGTYSKLRRVLDRKIFENGGLSKLPIDKEVVKQPMQEYTQSIRKLDVVKAKNAINVKDAKKGEEKVAGKQEAKKSAAKPKAAAKENKKPAKKAAKQEKKAKKAKAKDNKKKATAKTKSGSSYIEDVVTKSEIINLDNISTEIPRAKGDEGYKLYNTQTQTNSTTGQQGGRQLSAEEFEESLIESIAIAEGGKTEVARTSSELIEDNALSQAARDSQQQI